MGDGPVIDLSQVVFVDQFGEGLAPIVPYLLGGGGASGYKLGEVGEEIVAAALLEFGGEDGGPVGSVGFEGVGEDGVGWSVTEGFDEGFAYGFEVGGYGLVAEGRGMVGPEILSCCTGVGSQVRGGGGLGSRAGG